MDPEEKGFAARTVFVVGPDKTLKLSLLYVRETHCWHAVLCPRLCHAPCYAMYCTAVPPCWLGMRRCIWELDQPRLQRLVAGCPAWT